MIELTSFLGIPLKTQRQRRLLVVLYYGVLVGFAAAGLWVGKDAFVSLGAQTFVFGGLLGGIKMGGPVKPYAYPTLERDIDGPRGLNLQGRKPFDGSVTWTPLDERERTQRDVAHYMAYRILRWSLGVFVLAYFVGTRLAPVWLAENTLFLLWLFLLYVLSLPQAVVLWTEPAGPTEELAEVRRAAQ